MKELWIKLKHHVIIDGYEISSFGRIRFDNVKAHKPSYHSSNGYDYEYFVIRDECRISVTNIVRLFPIDDLVAQTFVPMPDELFGKPAKVEHIDGNLRNNHYENLRWVEDIEEWRDIAFLDVKPGKYQISSWGNIRDKTTGKLCNIHINGSGYPVVNLMRVNKFKGRTFKMHSVHKFVGLAFLKQTESIYLNHIDGIKTNPSPKNLEYVTLKDNTVHAINSGLKKHIPTDELDMVREMLVKYKYTRLVYDHIDHDKYPELTPNVIAHIKVGRYDRTNLNHNFRFHKGKLTVDEMDMVRDLLVKYNGDQNLAYDNMNHGKYPHITKQIVREIKCNKYSSYMKSKKYDLTKFHFDKLPLPSKLSTEVVDEIRDCLLKNNGSVYTTYLEMSSKYDYVSKDNVCDIKRGKCYKRSNTYNIAEFPKYPWR